jgi:hypothetical protein
MEKHTRIGQGSHQHRLPHNTVEVDTSKPVAVTKFLK